MTQIDLSPLWSGLQASCLLFDADPEVAFQPATLDS